VRRSPLLPRLFGRLTTVAHADGKANDARREQDDASAPSALFREAVTRAGAAAAAELTRALESSDRFEAHRIGELAVRQRERWERSALNALHKAWDRDRGRRPQPADRWLDPDGSRQERQFASYWAAALWGEPLIEAVKAAAADHFGEADRGRWREFQLVVPEI
jgi:hypothetical protein